ncbi:hypothetical protein [Burkholderia pseudomallei]|uniref:hypothetical protein n=1 Tax=Burkholderia pseudomallei TaxID=28450 RepID=UPI0005E397D4|nr:hypothetical protein [Burkholderia pseudomallei]ALC60071.1 hypothetical protein AMS56_25205 [Burkholderia pseudomallei]ARL52470.1 hypothetical protein BOC51_21185 [Burkholderia pseudomallei]KYZ79017.1 hypothetical protein PTBPS01_03860 [Burkholderia pseudomallei]OMT11833.1 hypothetical protein AQ753_17465 [Burkholderia pseudomallei]OMT15644.1 hypothetical protein AQ754_21900 [Burkholderia pseudomallei]
MQTKLFYEDEHEALQLMVSNSGKTIKEVASFLWPDMKPESAYAKLKTCLNPKGDEHFRFSQVIALMRFCGSFEPLFYVCDETMHARPDRKCPEDDAVKLVETIRCAADVLTKATAALDRLQGQTVAMRSVKRSA